MDLPELTICVCTYRRPEYGMLTLNALKQGLGYDGKRRFHIADGGSPAEEIEEYKNLLQGERVSVEITDNLSDMVNSCARNSGDIWIVALDDFCPRDPLNINPDAKYLITHSDVGVIRMARLNFWGSGSGDPETSADLESHEGYHWWKLSKERSRDKYMASIGFHLYHRRFWDAYGDIEPCSPHNPGQAELLACKRFLEKSGPTVAVPMRFGEDCVERREPIWHMGLWRSDDYTAETGKRL